MGDLGPPPSVGLICLEDALDPIGGRAAISICLRRHGEVAAPTRAAR